MSDRYDDLLLKARAEMSSQHRNRQAPTPNDLFESVWDGVIKNYDWGAAIQQQRQQMAQPPPEPPVAPAQSPAPLEGMRAQFNASRQAARMPNTGLSPSGIPWAPPGTQTGRPPSLPPQARGGAQVPPSLNIHEAGAQGLLNTLDASRGPTGSPPIGWQDQLTANAQAPPPPSYPGQPPSSPMPLGQAKTVLGGSPAPSNPGTGWTSPGIDQTVGIDRANEILGGAGAGAQTPPTMVPPAAPPTAPPIGQGALPPPSQASAGLLPAPGDTTQGQPRLPPQEAEQRQGFNEVNERSIKDKTLQHPSISPSVDEKGKIPKDPKLGAKGIAQGYKGDAAPKEEAPKEEAQAPKKGGDATPEAAKERSTKRGQQKLDLFGDDEKKTSHDVASHGAWSVLKDPFANPFDNPQAFALDPQFGTNKQEQYVEPVVHQEPVPQESQEFSEKLASVGLRATDDTSLLPQGMLQKMAPQEVDADTSLLPRGWAEGESA